MHGPRLPSTPSFGATDPLAGADGRPGSAWRHLDGWVAFELAPGWAVQQAQEAAVVVSPGGAEALLVVTGGLLEPALRQRTPGDLLRENGAALLAELQVQPSGAPADAGAILVRGPVGAIEALRRPGGRVYRAC